MMLRAALAFSLLAAIAPAAAAPPRAARAAQDWTRVVVQTPEGGIRIGNPKARSQLVEYGSFTCPHCGAFAREAFQPIIDRYVRTGRLSFEFRIALRDKADLVAALTARCAGPARFFGVAEGLFATQQDWFDRAVAFDQKQPQPPATADPTAVIGGLADGSGIAAIGVRHGIARPQLQRCYADAGLRDTLSKAAEDAWNVRQIGGTPAFYLNGDKLDGVYGWSALEPQLRAATHG